MAKKVPLADPRGVIPPDVLTRVPGMSSGEDPLSVTPLGDRGRNHVFLVRTVQGRYVVRLAAAGSLPRGVDRARELELHKIAAAGRFAPAVIYADPSAAVLITEYLDGREWSPASFSRLRDLRALATRLGQLHALPPPSLMRFDLAQALQDYGAAAVASGAVDRAACDTLMARASEALETSRTSQRVATIVHNDLHHGNVIVADRLYLIDWEYAVVGDPALDVACMLAYYPRATAHLVELLEAMQLRVLGVTPLMVSELAWAYEFMTYLWECLPGNTDASGADVAALRARRLRRLLANR